MTEPLHPKPEFRPGSNSVSGRQGGVPLSPSSASADADAFDAELRLIAEQAQMLTLASGAAIALRQGELMVCRARAGDTAPGLGARLDTQSGLSGECVRSGKTLICEDTENDPRVNLDVCRYLNIRSIAVLPISIGQQVLGVFEVFSAHPGAFGSKEVSALGGMRELVLSVIVPAQPRQAPPQAAAAAAGAVRAKAETVAPVRAKADTAPLPASVKVEMPPPAPARSQIAPPAPPKFQAPPPVRLPAAAAAPPRPPATMATQAQPQPAKIETAPAPARAKTEPVSPPAFIQPQAAGPLQPWPSLLPDRGDDLICELELPPEQDPDKDPLLRALELLKPSGPGAPAKGSPVANADPDDDLMCEIEMRGGAQFLQLPPEKEHLGGLSAFAPAVAHPPERPISRKLIVAGAAAVVLGLAWLGWCNHAQQETRLGTPAGIVHAAPDPPGVAKLPPAVPHSTAPSSPARQNAPTADAPQAAQPPPVSENRRAAEPLHAAAIHDLPEPKPAVRTSRPARQPPKKTEISKAQPSRTPASAPQTVARNLPPSTSPANQPGASSASATSRAANPIAPAAPAAVPAQPAPPSASPTPAPAPATPPPAGLSLAQAVVSIKPELDEGEGANREAIRLLRNSADAGDASAQLALAVRYANGDGVRQSYPEALKWFTRAQTQGVAIPSGSPAEQAWSKVQSWAKSRDKKR